MVKENMTLTTFTKFLNENYVKKTKKKFTVGDAQGYIKRRHLPLYLGGNTIVMKRIAEGVVLYNLKSHAE